MEMLPLIKPVPGEKRAKRQPLDQEQRDAMEDALAAMIEMDPDEFNECMKESGLAYTYEDLLSLQEEGEKLRLLGVLQEETQALIPAIIELQKTLGERAKELLAGALPMAALRKAAGGRGAAN
jgi:hypothetical protein